MKRPAPPKHPSACQGRGLTSILQDHPFVPSGKPKLYGCAQWGRCRSNGVHEACATCGWPADEHPASGAR